MRPTHIAVRAALVLGAAGAGVALWSAADTTAAYAADRPAAVEQPGGLLDGAVQLPDRAADAAQDAIDAATPRQGRDEPTDKPTRHTDKPVKPQPAQSQEPAPEHAPEPAGDSEPTEGRPRDPEPTPTTPIGDAADDVKDSVEDVVEVITTPPPVPLPTPAAPLPVLTTPLPAGDLAVPDVPVPAPVHVELPRILPSVAPAPPGLPLLIGPVAAPATPDPARAHDEPTVAALTAERPSCTDGLDLHVDPRRIRIPLDLAHYTDKAAAARPSGPPCPGPPCGPADPACTLESVPAHTTYGAEQQPGDTTGLLIWPALHRLYELRPRSAIAAGRSTHPEPGPA